MLKRTALGVATIVLIGSAAYAADNSNPITKDPETPGLDLIIRDDAPAQGGGGGTDAPATNPGPSGPTLSDGLQALCAGTTGQAITNGGLTNAICVALEGEEDPDTVDAAAVARTLLDRLDIPRPQMNTSPQAPVKALVGLETWLWVPPAQWEPLELSASLGGTTVTVTARPIQSRWDMGEGTKACGGPGRVWRKGLGQKATTPCGYTYKRTSVREPNDKYEVSAVMRYAITWTCTGDCSAGAGDLGTLDSLADTAQLEVGERQSVVIR